MGKRIICEVEYGEEENEDGKSVDCVYVTCPKCEETEMSWGDGSDSVKRSCAVLAKNCGCGNWLVVKE